jgi:two-component system phosphate regulon sensor histidine kinase PhoR
MDNVQDLQRELQQLKRQLADATGARDEAERSKNEYMQNVAHQLAAPINAIKMNIETLSNPKVQISRKQVLLRSIYSQGTILAHSIKNFSLMSHLEANHNIDSFREKPEFVDLCLLCVNFTNDFQPIGFAKGQTIKVLDDEFDKYNHPRIWVIKNLFSQVIYNLLENATKYADSDSKITIGVRCDQSWISTIVTSTGIPIAPQDVKRIFERGFRGASANARHPAGTGFGLYIARRIVEIHKGEIAVEPSGNKSVFIVRCQKDGNSLIL